ncbi:MAG TPA: sensor histidine kinase [Pyrinomonadaceae bacterium]|jgi:signal transduction histidine kinase
MKLSKFIIENMEAILTEWESFAKTILPAAETMDSPALRDHAKQILEAVAKDIETSQTDRQQSDKSKDLAPVPAGRESAATTHGALRHLAGFDLKQLGSEYRALRASVISMWRAQLTEVGDSEFNDMMRFNEAIDEALAASIVRYSDEVDRSRQTFLAILGHDLRSPLNSISMAASYLLKSGGLANQQMSVVTNAKKSVSTMSRMINDLLAYASAQIGREIPILPAAANMENICRAALDEIQTAYPEVVFHFETAGELNGRFDAARMQQVLSNLLNNAVKYGEKGLPLTLSATGEAETITLQVKNLGNVIPPESMQVIFNPLIQLPAKEATSGAHLSASIGLGLFITREIVKGHNGTIKVESTENGGTVFSIRLPRN